ncbi:DUF6309 family protein [Streptomyces sp. NBC_00829]|uniref:DUF6309 family protein n=1 Tax=Streptomyces sp. NBC_00829 TaxID=2903679 RepID=UPI003863FE30|nr:DUF6309 family protein [Streptomyces sp. NBC_00829]
MRVLKAITFDALTSLFGRAHPYDPNDEANSNDEAETHIRNAQLTLGGRWHQVMLEGTEVLDIVLPWHSGEAGDVELIPRTGLTVAAAASRLAVLGTSYADTNPLCALKLARQTHASPRPLFLSTRPVSGQDYEALTVREGLIHLDGLHRMLAWQRAGLLVPGWWVKAYVAGLSPADVGHGARHEQDGLDVHPGR